MRVDVICLKWSVYILSLSYYFLSKRVFRLISESKYNFDSIHKLTKYLTIIKIHKSNIFKPVFNEVFAAKFSNESLESVLKNLKLMSLKGVIQHFLKSFARETFKIINF